MRRTRDARDDMKKRDDEKEKKKLVIFLKYDLFIFCN